MTTFEVALVSRTPLSGTTPTLTVLDRLVVETISYTEELNRAGTATFGCPVQAMSSTVKAQLLDMRATPSEVWVYADSAILWAGAVQTLNIQGQTVQLDCIGLLGYAFRMGVIADLVYSATDQFTIAAGLINQFQAQTYGNYGIDTSTVGTSGVTRDRTYLRNDLHNVGQRLQELGAVIDGFDMKVDPTTRKLVMTNPQQGTDLSASIFLDERNIDSAQVSVSTGPDDVISDVACTGTSTTSAGINSVLYSLRTTASVQTSFGRSWHGQNFDGISVQATLDGAGDAYLAPRSGQLFLPGVTAFVNANADIGSFHVGDTISYSYDAGIGRQTLALRVAKLTVDINSAGAQRQKVEFI